MPDFDTAWKEALEALFEPFMAFFDRDNRRARDWGLVGKMQNDLRLCVELRAARRSLRLLDAIDAFGTARQDAV